MKVLREVIETCPKCDGRAWVRAVYPRSGVTCGQSVTCPTCYGMGEVTRIPTLEERVKYIEDQFNGEEE